MTLFAALDWNPLIVAFAASLPGMILLLGAWVKLREMQVTGLKTLHHVNSGTVISARALEAAARALWIAEPTDGNLTKYKAAVVDLERAIIIQKETADLLLRMGGKKDTVDEVPPAAPLEVVLTSKDVKGTQEQLATKQDVKDALANK